MFSALLLFSQLSVFALDNPQNSFPNLYGGSGVLRTFSAQPNEPTTFGAHLLGNFFTKDPFLNGLKNSRNQFRIDGNYTFDFKLPIELFGGFTFTYNDNSNTVAATTMTTFFENADLGVRVGKSVGYENFYLGGYAYVRALSGTRAFRNTSGGTAQKSGPVVSGAVGFTQTLDMSKKWEKLPLRQNFTVGYRAPNGNLNAANDDFNRFALDAFKYQAIVPALSIEALYKYITPFIELSMEYALGTGADKGVEFSDNRKKVTLGTRISPLSSFSILVAGDIGIGGPREGKAVGIPRNPPYDIYIGLAFQTLGSRLAAETGSVRGVVTDQATGSPLNDVKITLLNESNAPLQTDESGIYEFEILKNGNYQAQFEKPGYEKTIKSFSVRNGNDTLLDASLAIAGPKSGTLEVVVLDQETQAPIRRAIVSVSGFDGGLATDDLGKVNIRALMEGEHSIAVEAPGYATGTSSATIQPEQLVTQTVLLQKAAPETGTCEGTVKNVDGTPLTAVFTDTQGTIPHFGTDPVTGAFSGTMPPGTYEFKVQAENYLPQTVQCTVSAGQTSTIDIALEKPKQAVIIENKIVLPDAIYFEFGRSDIKSESLPVLDQVVDILLKSEGAFDQLKVEGHTDDVGGAAYNQSLSEKRAASVRMYLLKKGIKGSKVVSSGFGKTKPIATNLTPEGRAENRRVEFNLVRNTP